MAVVGNVATARLLRNTTAVVEASGTIPTTTDAVKERIDPDDFSNFDVPDEFVEGAGLQVPFGTEILGRGQDPRLFLDNIGGFTSLDARAGAFSANKDNIPPPLRPTPNHLSDYQSWTYKFSFFMAKLDALTKDPRKTEKIILAESGATNLFTIKNLQIKSFIAPGFQTRTFLPTKMEFELWEPHGGALFYDALLESANILSIENYINAPFFLTLDWLGYDANGLPIIIDDDEVRSKIWAMKIIEIKSTLTNEGSLYRIKCVEFEHWMSANKFLVMDNHLNIPAKTVGEFFQKLQKEINKMERQGSLYRLYPDEYTFDIDPQIAKIRLKESDPSESPQRQNSTKKMDKTVTVIEVPRGYDMSAIIEDLMVACEDWVKDAMTDGSDPNVQTSDTKNVIKKNKRIWMMDAEVIIDKYDAAVNDYQKKITYNIGTYRTTRANINPATYINSTDEEVKRRDEQLLEERSIGKLYEYLYTGKNTEVLNLEVDFNYMWTTNVPLYAGLQQQRPLDEGPVVSNQPQNRETLATQYQKANQAFASLGQSFSGPEPSDDLVRSLIRDALTEKIVLEKKLDVFRERRDQLEGINDNILAQLSQDKEKLFASTLLEDLGKREDTKASPIPVPRTFTSDASRPESQYRGLIEGSYRPFRSIAAAVLDNIYYGHAELMRIDLEIRGDPAWLGITGVEKRLKGIRFEPLTEEDNMADRMGREDTMMVIEMKQTDFENKESGLLNLATRHDPNTGKETEVIISGVYQVTQVNHNFNEGAFTQTLTSLKDIEITRMRNTERLKANLD